MVLFHPALHGFTRSCTPPVAGVVNCQFSVISHTQLRCDGLRYKVYGLLGFAGNHQFAVFSLEFLLSVSDMGPYALLYQPSAFFSRLKLFRLKAVRGSIAEFFRGS
jgi:hypothetical protein